MKTARTCALRAQLDHWGIAKRAGQASTNQHRGLTNAVSVLSTRAVLRTAHTARATWDSQGRMVVRADLVLQESTRIRPYPRLAPSVGLASTRLTLVLPLKQHVMTVKRASMQKPQELPTRMIV